jgi:hypothetical protein
MYFNTFNNGLFGVTDNNYIEELLLSRFEAVPMLA